MPGLEFDVCGLRQLRNQGLSKVEPGRVSVRVQVPAHSEVLGRGPV